MSQSNQTMDRLEQLLADEAAYGMDPTTGTEIEEMIESGTGTGPERDDFMRVASLMQLGFLKKDQGAAERMPDVLREKLAQQAQDFFSQQPTQARLSSVTDIRSARKPNEESAPVSPTRSWLNPDRAGWAVAASLILAFFLLRPDQAPPPAETSLTQQRAALMASANAIIAPWAGGVAADGYEDVAGDVVWSDSEQAGYMRLSGLVANNQASAQYQLWIVDPDRDERPVDGGVFNVPAGVDEIIIPIDAKLNIGAPAAFAITLEQPGGVVVSAGPLLVVAPVTG